ncbi:MAG: hypothetical protein R3324_14340 [Halobacteriales archaeon]|nr:hypothetical protein [Halobacteriales archaeon]
MSDDGTTGTPDDPEKATIVLSYLGEDVFHRPDDADDMRPACRPTRMRGALIQRHTARREGLKPCPECWNVPSDDG